MLCVQFRTYSERKCLFGIAVITHQVPLAPYLFDQVDLYYYKGGCVALQQSCALSMLKSRRMSPFQKDRLILRY
jgi:hypothetical protein